MDEKEGGSDVPNHKRHMLLQQKLMHFVNTFHQYVMDRVLYSAWIELCQGMASAGSLDEVIACHEAYLVSIQRQCFVAPDKLWALIASRVKTILGLALDFYSIQHTLCSGGAAPAIKARCQMEVDRVGHQFDECIVNEYCALDFCGQAPKEPENLDPDSAESRLNFPSPFNEFKIWQKGCWQKPPHFDKFQQSTVPTVLGSPWIQHFRKLVSSNKRAVSLSSVNESLGTGAEKGEVMLKHPGNTITAIEKASNVGQGTCAWHHRLQSNYTGSPSLCGKRDMSSVYDKMFNVSATAITDRNIDDEAKVGRSQGNNLLGADHNFEGSARRERNVKILKVNVVGGCSSSKDQVVPLLGSFNAVEAGDCNYTSKVQGFSADTDQQFNDSINSLPATIKNRTSFLKYEQL